MLTNEERNYLKESIIDLLEEYDYEWTSYGIEVENPCTYVVSMLRLSGSRNS